MRALFFLRHYNDADHITPVIDRWVREGHECDVVLIGFGRFRGDYRIEHLRRLAGVRIAHVRHILPLPVYVFWRLQMALVLSSLRRPVVRHMLAALARLWNRRCRQPLWRISAGRLLDRSFAPGDEGVVAFDWVERNSAIATEWIHVLLKMARNRGLGTVSLPHGDSPHASQLIRRTELRLGPDTVFERAGMFDTVVVPNDMCAQRFRPFLEPARIAVPGSARYCDEWRQRLTDIAPPSPLVRRDNQLHLVMFLRRRNFTTFWEEVRLVIRMIAAFPNVQLLLKPHTRGGWLQFVTSDFRIRRLPNVHVANNAHSVQLVNWADAIVDVATSASFEAVKYNKPVLAADYLHAGRSTVAHYMPETELRCRDDVFIKMETLLTRGCRDYYVPEHRQRFIREMIDVGGPDVLGRYVALLRRAAGQSLAGAHPRAPAHAGG